MPFAPGDILDSYKLLEPCGHGACGDVWIVENMTGQRLAMKIFSKSKLGISEMEGLKALSRMPKAPSLIQIYHVGEKDDCYFYVMELADNLNGDSAEYIPASLNRIIENQGGNTAENTVRLGLSLLAGLNVIHKAGFIHRDIKPENILIINKQPTITDVGLLIKANDFVSLGGTLGFIPPERLAEGTNHTTSHLDDIYALGMVLYCYWTGNEAENFPSLPTRPLNMPDDSELNKVLKKACCREPQERFKNVDDFTSALQKLLPDNNKQRASNQKLHLWQLLIIIAGFLASVLCYWNIKHNKETSIPKSVPPKPEITSTVQQQPQNTTQKATTQRKPLLPEEKIKLVVTTEQDVVDENDGLVSLREAVEFAKTLQSPYAVISFASDFNIHLNSSLVIDKTIFISGGEHSISITGADTAPIFSFADNDAPKKLTCRYLKLISNMSGQDAGIMTVSPNCTVWLQAIQDGGNATYLWKGGGDKCILYVGLNSNIHNAAVVTSPSYDEGCKIFVDKTSKIYNVEVTGTAGRGGGDLVLSGTCPTRIHVRTKGDLYMKENANANQVFLDTNACLLIEGKNLVNNLFMGYGSACFYNSESKIKKKLLIAGVMRFKATQGAPLLKSIVTPYTNVAFDLSDWFPNRNVSFFHPHLSFAKNIDGNVLLDYFQALEGAQFYSIVLAQEQPKGTYILAEHAAECKASFLVCHKGHPPILLKPDENFADESRAYSLSIQEERLLFTVK